MSAYPSLPLFTDAFIADTMHLSAQETGAYLMLMMVAWRTPDCRLPDDDDRLARFARVDRRTWARIKPTILEFWTLQDGCWSQKRLSKEREFVSKRAEVNRKNGEQGGRPKSLENNEAQNPAGSVRVSETKAPKPNPTTSLRSVGSVPARQHVWPDNFREEIWITYGKGIDKKPGMLALEALWKADRLPYTELIEAVRQQAISVPDPKYRPSLERWIKKEKWTDKHEKQGAKNGSEPTDLFARRSAGHRYAGSVHANVSSAVARHADRRGVGLGGREDDPGSRDQGGDRPRRDDPDIEDADWTPTQRHYATH